ncbi:MAG TPA: hypothetical protein VHY22_07055 [Chthoniobacteraceae bacterium]|nr:hypothetical protein [Chthoniobacteraceae bacterium]
MEVTTFTAIPSAMGAISAEAMVAAAPSLDMAVVMAVVMEVAGEATICRGLHVLPGDLRSCGLWWGIADDVDPGQSG